MHHSGTNPAEKKKIETEQEAWRTVNAMFENEKNAFIKALKEKDQIIADLLKKLDEKK